MIVRCFCATTTFLFALLVVIGGAPPRNDAPVQLTYTATLYSNVLNKEHIDSVAEVGVYKI